MREIEFCGVLSERTGQRRFSLDVDGPLTVAQALDELCRLYPTLQADLPRTACAVGDRLVQRDESFADGQTLVLLPPVSGG